MNNIKEQVVEETTAKTAIEVCGKSTHPECRKDECFLENIQPDKENEKKVKWKFKFRSGKMAYTINGSHLPHLNLVPVFVDKYIILDGYTGLHLINIK